MTKTGLICEGNTVTLFVQNHKTAIFTITEREDGDADVKFEFEGGILSDEDANKLAQGLSEAIGLLYLLNSETI